MKLISDIKLNGFDLREEIRYKSLVIDKIKEDQISPLEKQINTCRYKIQQLMPHKRAIDEYVKIHGIEPTHVFSDIDDYYGYKKSHDVCVKDSSMMNRDGKIYVIME